MRELLHVNPLDGYPSDIGRWLWALEDARRITKRAVDGLDVAALDWRGPDGRENSIGSLLYHVAGVEMGWLFIDVLGRAFPLEVEADLRFEAWTDGRLTHVGGVTLEQHLGRLDRTRGVFLDHLRRMDVAEFRRVRAPENEDYQVTPEWVVYHLVEHEVGHAYQMRSLARRAAKHLGGAVR